MREKDTMRSDHAVSHSPRTDDCFRYASFLLLFFFHLVLFSIFCFVSFKNKNKNKTDVKEN